MNIINSNTKIIVGKNSLDYLKDYKNKNILIITDKFLAHSELIDNVLKNLSENKVNLFDEVFPDPTLNTVKNALKQLLLNEIDILIAFGGGSPIDAAKAVAYVAQKGYMRNCELIAIPTTSGTGSEVTSVAVIKDEDKHLKHLLKSELMLPKVAIIDAELTKSLPNTIVANTGMDVFTHALEAYVGKNSNIFSDALSEKAGEIVVKHLYKSYKGEEYSKEQMHYASTLAGMSFEIAGLGLNHAIAHQIGGQFGVTHGLANSLLLEKVIDYNSSNNDVMKKYVKYAVKIGLANNSMSDEKTIVLLKGFIRAIQRLMNIPQNISKCNISKEVYFSKLKKIAINAKKDNCMKTTPINITEEAIIKILKKIF